MCYAISKLSFTVPLHLPRPLSTSTIPGHCDGDRQGLAVFESESGDRQGKDSEFGEGLKGGFGTLESRLKEEGEELVGDGDCT